MDQLAIEVRQAELDQAHRQLVGRRTQLQEELGGIIARINAVEGIMAENQRWLERIADVTQQQLGDMADTVQQQLERMADNGEVEPEGDE